MGNLPRVIHPNVVKAKKRAIHHRLNQHHLIMPPLELITRTPLVRIMNHQLPTVQKPVNQAKHPL